MQSAANDDEDDRNADYCDDWRIFAMMMMTIMMMIIRTEQSAVRSQKSEARSRNA
jgi:hypothetical protein